MPSPTVPLPYQLKFETVSGSGDDLQLRSLLDRQQFHDPLGEAEAQGISSAAWPIFGMLWPSSRVLAHVMLSFELEGGELRVNPLPSTTWHDLWHTAESAPRPKAPVDVDAAIQAAVRQRISR